MSEAPPRAMDPWQHRVELVGAIMLGVATILTAWAAFQSAKWSGRQGVAAADSTSYRTMAARDASRVDQEKTIDLMTFIAWAQAVASETPAAELETRGYVPRHGTLSNFLYSRLRKEFKPAVEAWLATKPFQNRESPATPFNMPEYRLASAEEMKLMNEKADARGAESRVFILRSDRYVAVTVVLAMVLFLVGLANSMQSRTVQKAVLAWAMVFLVAGCVALLTFPVELGRPE